MSINYSEWQIQKVEVKDLQLDPQNPRLSELENPTQEQIREQLIKYEDVLGLALRIAERGFLPSEVLIAYKDGASTYVLEGNRRLAACQLLLDPTKAPAKYSKRFQSLSGEINKDNLKKINVLFSPNRKDADYIIAGRHTETPIKKWRLMDQANFYYRRLKDGESIENLAKSVGVNATKIKDLVNSYNMCLRARHLPLSKIAKDQLFNLEDDDKKSKFDLSTLGRIIQSKPGRENLKLSYNESGGLKITGDEKKFDSKLKNIVEDIANKKINSRVLSKTAAIEKYLKSPVEFKKTNQITDGKPGKAKVASSAKSIVPASVLCGIDHGRIKDTFGELQRPELIKSPNAYASTLRLLLELATYIYMDRNGQLESYRKDYLATQSSKKKVTIKEVPDTWPNLRDLLQRLIAHDASIDKKIKNALKKYVDHKSEEPLLDDLNSFMHNPNYLPTKALLTQKWKQLEGYLGHILKRKA